MHIFIEGESSEPPVRGACTAVGNFDGVHAGHRVVIAAAQAHAAAMGAPSAVTVFEPPPRQFFQPGAPPFRLQSPGQRARALAALDVDVLYTLKFDAAMARLKREEFVRKVLYEQLGVRGLVAGFDFTFGANRSGDAEILKRLGHELGIVTDIVPAVRSSLDADAKKISSTAIREAIGGGEMEEAAELLGRPWAIEGVVIRGEALGRKLGFPTANIRLGDYMRPRFGIYAARVDIGDSAPRPAIVSIGVRPTVTSAGEPLLEAHLFDFDGDLYDRRLEVSLLRFQRAELRFDDVAGMTEQMVQDCEQARRILSGT